VQRVSVSTQAKTTSCNNKRSSVQ